MVIIKIKFCIYLERINYFIRSYFFKFFYFFITNFFIVFFLILLSSLLAFLSSVSIESANSFSVLSPYFLIQPFCFIIGISFFSLSFSSSSISISLSFLFRGLIFIRIYLYCFLNLIILIHYFLKICFFDY